MNLYFNTVDEANQAFDDFKMQGDYSSIIELVRKNNEMLSSAGWKCDSIISKCETIINVFQDL